MRRLQPELCRCAAELTANQHTQPTIGDGAKRAFFGGAIAQVGHGRALAKFGQNVSRNVTVIAGKGAQFQAAT